MKVTHKPADPDYILLNGRHEYQVTAAVSAVVENGQITFYRDGEAVLSLSEWDHSEFDTAYVSDRIEQIVNKRRTNEEAEDVVD